MLCNYLHTWLSLAAVIVDDGSHVPCGNGCCDMVVVVIFLTCLIVKVDDDDDN